MVINKKGQNAIVAFVMVGFLIVLAIPGYHIYSSMLQPFLDSNPSTMTIIIIYLLPLAFIIGMIYTFVSRLRKSSQY
jgi:hypothetical protein